MSRSKRKNTRQRSKPRPDKETPSLLDGHWRKVSAQAGADAEYEEEAMPRNSLGVTLRNSIIGLSFLPIAWIFTDALFSAFAMAHPAGSRVPFYMTHEFLMFSLGGVGWLLWFFFSLWFWGEPRPLRAYIWGHELIHVLVARMCGGKVKDYHVTREGGYIVTDRYNAFIALAPYLWPFACVPVLAAWGLWLLLGDPSPHTSWLLAALGATWSFHITFTLWMMPRGQTDFHGPGHVFSLTMIYLINIALLSIALITLAPEVPWSLYFSELKASTIQFHIEAAALLDRILR